MKKAIKMLLLGAAFLPLAAGASEGEVKLDHADISFDRESIQNGAKIFAEYCFSCHSLKYMRYNMLENQLGMPENVVKEQIMLPDGAKINGNMTITMSPEDAAVWFGKAPPDLTLEARYRGADWIYTYLRSFYRDDSRPTGWNNHVFPMVAMPNVLASLSGEKTKDGKVIRAGTVSQAKFDDMVRDLTAFLTYTSDPSELKRMSMGPLVLGFLLIFTILAYLLKKEYWRDVH
ncbi:cytochrome c1 [Thermithiobacillus plumbiphilus]|uniref:Cytochrome c1 n=1 Tax=Thermithiobacillus plumbiphilus TaxID=1729899 RepID=A0ABU9D8W8_9PROT